MPYTPEQGKWWHKPFGVVQTNLREIDASMDVNFVAEWIQDFGATAWLVSVGGIQAQYPTNLPFHTRNPYLVERKSGDLVGDAIQAAHSRGLKLLARMDFSKVTPQVASQYPEWCYVSPEGNMQTHTAGLISVCPSGAYYQQRIFEILDEVTSRYKIDGIFFNWATMNEEDYFKHYHGVCHCFSCQIRWRDYSGSLELPKRPQDTNYAQWLTFSRQLVNDITARIRCFVSERLPNTCMIRGASADVIYQESNNEMSREFWSHLTSESVSSWKTWRPEVPVIVNSTCFYDIPYRMASENAAHFSQYLIQCISRGGTPSTYMMGTPGKIPYACLSIAREITQFHNRWSEIYYDMQPAATTGLVRPDRGYMEAKDHYHALSEFRGLYSALQELHIPFDVLAMEHFAGVHAKGGIKRFNLIILPDLGQLPLEHVVIFDDWVKRGGTLISTGGTAVDEKGCVQLQSLPSDRIHTTVTRNEGLWSSYVARHQKEPNIHYYDGPIVPLYGAYYEFGWRYGTRGEYNILARAPFAPPEKAYGNLEVDQPGYAMSQYGLGQAITVPFTVGRGYNETGLDVFRNFFSQICGKARLESNLSFQLDEHVEVTVHQTGTKTVLHLINMSGARKSNFGSHLPITTGCIKVSNRQVKARALKADVDLEVLGGRIQLPTLDLFEVVLIEDVIQDLDNEIDAGNGINLPKKQIVWTDVKQVCEVNSTDGINGVYKDDSIDGVNEIDNQDPKVVS